MTGTLLAVLLITVLVVTAGYFLLRFLVRFSRKPVLEITLSPVENPKWSDDKKVSGLIDAFRKNGFETAGHFESPEIPCRVSGFVKPSGQLAGVIYDHPVAGIWVDVYVQYHDGGSLTVSNVPMGQAMDHMPGQEKIYSRGSSLDELLEKVGTGRKKAGCIAITKDDFAANFEAAYRKEMKWRMDRGGPTSDEVMRVAMEKGVSLDSEKLLTQTRIIQNEWRKEKDKPQKIKVKRQGAGLPGEFREPDRFRQSMEQKSEAMPQSTVPSLPVYVALIAALAGWTYYGFQYNEIHRPLSFAALMIFLAVFLGLFVILMWFRVYQKQVKLGPRLKRIAGLRPGAFVFISGAVPMLFYAREKWIGKVVFREGGESEDAGTALEVVVKDTGGWLSISRKSRIGELFGRSDKHRIPLPDNEFGRVFAVSASDGAFADQWLSAGLQTEMLRLNRLKNPGVNVDGQSVVINIEADLSGGRRETDLVQFLEAAENIIETVVQRA